MTFETQGLTVTNRDGFAHIFLERELAAMRAAMAANRPLLIRGEPGVGKTQLARAAAIKLERPLVSLTVDANTEPNDVMWSYDAIQRLAEAQVAAATISVDCESKDRAAALQKQIDPKRFVQPGPLWWAYSWKTAVGQLRPGQESPDTPDDWNAETGGVVVLIDEIDKAESEVPNGMLEALGSRQFRPQGWQNPICLSQDVPAPLIIITTNEERVLPDAFIRRCFVLHLELPEIAAHESSSPNDQDQEFVQFLAQRGRAHFPLDQFKHATEEVLREAAELLLTDRRSAMQQQQKPLPGQAEYLDFLGAVVGLLNDGSDRSELLQQVRQFVFQKSRKRSG